MTIWRWRHDRSPLPEWVWKILNDLVQDKVREAHEAQQEFRYFLQEPPKPPRKLSGCCAGRYRKPKKWPMTEKVLGAGATERLPVLPLSPRSRLW
jgi:hypothetical protein